MWEIGNRGRVYNLETREVKCTECKKIKSFDDFFKSNGKFLGLVAKCKECESKKRKLKRSKENPEVRKVIDGIDVVKHLRTRTFFNVELEVKTCTICGDLLHKSKFRRLAAGILGTNPSCKKCESKNQKRYFYPETEKEIRRATLANFISGVVRLSSDSIEDEFVFDKDTKELFYVLNQAIRETGKELKKRNNTDMKNLLKFSHRGKPHSKAFKFYTKLH